MHRLIYILLFPFLWLTSILPMWLLYLKSDFLYFIAYYLVGYRKKVVMNNLELVFPKKSNAERRKIARKFYRHLCDLIYETIKSMTISEKEIKKRFVYENLDLINELHKTGRSILLFCGHYASWEWSGILTRQMKHEGLAVYKKLDNPFFDRLVKKIRGRFGASIVSNKKIVQTLFRMHKEGRRSLTLVLADQTPKAGAFKHRDSFMGIDVPVFTGTEELAKKLDFSVMYLQVRKERRGFYKARFIPLAERPNEFSDYKITRLFLDEIERQIDDEPAYYLWSHKRWKLRN